MVDCPKCSKGYLPQYAAIMGGVCFLCQGRGRVTEQEASSWLAHQARQGLPSDASCGTEAPPTHARACKAVTLPILGSATISRHEDGTFILTTQSNVGELRSHFGVTKGRVWLQHVCNGHLEAHSTLDDLGDPNWSTRARMALRAELQGALKVKA